jgi:hypothetical protein
VHAFGDAVKEAGKASPEGEGNCAKSTFEDLVQYNDGFRTNLIGTPQQIAERIVALKAIGVDLVLAGFLHFIEEVEYFGQRVLPLVRELEAQRQAIAKGPRLGRGRGRVRCISSCGLADSQTGGAIEEPREDEDFGIMIGG